MLRINEYLTSPSPGLGGDNEMCSAVCFSFPAAPAWSSGFKVSIGFICAVGFLGFAVHVTRIFWEIGFRFVGKPWREGLWQIFGDGTFFESLKWLKEWNGMEKIEFWHWFYVTGWYTDQIHRIFKIKGKKNKSGLSKLSQIKIINSAYFIQT